MDADGVATLCVSSRSRSQCCEEAVSEQPGEHSREPLRRRAQRGGVGGSPPGSAAELRPRGSWGGQTPRDAGWGALFLLPRGGLSVRALSDTGEAERAKGDERRAVGLEDKEGVGRGMGKGQRGGKWRILVCIQSGLRRLRDIHGGRGTQ